ncbi:hypothetical protein FBEOM_10374 [Fusarium beomiforme]|uniref:Apple domain-containing protein n=1 Tax=Fusarium beomiforme TaxID=44412 RepID=A0A9P5ACJ8_9HYPO|nr:hypothetical protein FBEOM_10374 [Fusarium beomiforme]
MIATRSILGLFAVAGIASAGKCKPVKPSSSTVSETSSGSAGLTTTETASVGSSLTTLLTSFVTTSADTTTAESAATTTSAAPAVATCPSEVDQCIDTIEIKCGYTFTGLSTSSFVNNLNDCVQICSSSSDCVAFTYSESLSVCYTATSLSQIADQFSSQGYDSGIKGTCGQDTGSTSTVFMSTTETTTTEAATSTAPAVDPVCSSCIGSAQVLCDTTLSDLQIVGFSNNLADCAAICEADDDCQGFTRRQDTGACFKAINDNGSVTQSPQEGRDSGIKYSCTQ